jgi:hypothetical protein
LYVHLSEVLDREESIETIARFLILSEKWPGVVDILRTQPDYLDQFQKNRSLKATDPKDEDEEKLCNELLPVLKDSEIEPLLTNNPPISSSALLSLCDWMGFQFYKQGDVLSKGGSTSEEKEGA